MGSTGNTEVVLVVDSVAGADVEPLVSLELPLSSESVDTTMGASALSPLPHAASSTPATINDTKRWLRMSS